MAAIGGRAKPQALFGLLGMIVPYGLGVILLTTFVGGSSAANFNTVTAFAIIGGFSFMFLMAMQPYNKDLVWFDSPDKKDLVYLFALPLGGKKVVPFGLAGLLVFGLFLPQWFGVYGILVALGIGGGVLGYQLKKSQSVFIPWSTHFMYNSVAVLMASFSIIPLAASPIYVPDFGSLIADRLPTASLFTQLSLSLGMQLVVVTLAEELLKVSIAVGATLLFKRAGVGFAIGLSIVLWTILHTVLSYKLYLNI
jgi:hypothetical protein